MQRFVTGFVSPVRLFLIFFCPAGMLIVNGCETADPVCRQLSRQQAMTIESLNAEVIRLNHEIDSVIVSRAQLSKVKDQWVSDFSKDIRANDLTVTLEKKGLVIRYLETALFEPEQITIRTSSAMVLDKVADALAGDLADYKVIIEGHVDGELPADSGWRSGWEYSGAIATEVLHYFVGDCHLPASRFEVSSFSHYRNINPGQDGEGKDSDRRIEIVIAPQKTGAV